MERLFWIVETDKPRHERFELHSITAPTLFTWEPQPGDRIVATGRYINRGTGVNAYVRGADLDFYSVSSDSGDHDILETLYEDKSRDWEYQAARITLIDGRYAPFSERSIAARFQRGERGL